MTEDAVTATTQTEHGRVIARRRLRCSFQGSPEREVELLIHEPAPDGDGWRCVAALENLFRDVAVARGVDSLQALQLAMREVTGTLARIIDGGGSVSWEDGSGQLTPEDLLL